MAAQKKKIRGSDRIFNMVNNIILTIILLIVLLPLIYVISASFSDPQAVIGGKVFLWPVKPTLRAYKAVFSNQKFRMGFVNSFFYMGTGTAVNIVMTLLCAYALSRKEFRAGKKLTPFFIFTMYFSGGLVPTYMLVKGLHMINSVWAMIFPGAMSVYNMVICRSYMINSIPDELYEAGVMDGCTPFRYLIKVAIPLSKPVIAVLTLYYAVGKWNDYYAPMLYLNETSLQPLTTVLREILIMGNIDQSSMSAMDMENMAARAGLAELLKYAVIVVASVPVMLIYPFVQKYFVKGVMIGAVKG